MQRAEVQRGDVQVIHPGVAAGACLVRVAAITASQRAKALIADGDHVVGVERFDVLGRCGRPVVDDGAETR